MASLAEYFQAFHKYAVENDLSASARAMYYTLLGEFNARFWRVDKLSISVRDMQVLGGFQSSSVVDRAKTVLGTENIVKIQKLKNRKNQYELVEPQFWLRNSCSIVEGQVRDTCRTLAGHERNEPFIKYTLNEATEEDGKTVRLKDGEGGGARASASVYTGESAGKATTPTSPRQNPSGKAVEVAGSKTVSLTQKYCSEELEKCWIMNSGQQPNDGICMKLGAMSKEYGEARVKAAIEEANYRNQGGCININFVQSVLVRMLRGGKKVGTEQNNGGNERIGTDYDEGFFD